MSQTRKPRTTAGVWLGLVFVGMIAAPRLGAADEPALASLANRCVVRFDVKREPAVGQKDRSGSGVLIALDPADAQPRRATLVTAYHVLYLAQSFNLFGVGGARIDFDAAKTTCYVDRSRELAFVRVILRPQKDGPALEAISSEPPDASPDLLPGAMLFGYAEDELAALQALRVELLGVANAANLNLRRPGIPFIAPIGQVDPNRMTFQRLGGQATLPGMSGGLGVDAAGHCVGILYGRRRDRYSLLIPGDQINKVWKAIRGKDDKTWELFAPEKFAGEILYRGDQDGSDPAAAEDRMDWGTLDSLKMLLGDDPARALEQFEELEITPRVVNERTPPVKIYVGPNTIPNQSHDLRIWHDGREITWDRDRGVAVVQIADKPGESLLTVLKTSGRVNDFELGGLLLPSTVDLEFSQGEDPTVLRHIVRSLPALTQTYPLFITIRNSPGAEPRGPTSGVRIAVRLDYLEALLNRVPFRIHVADGEEDHRDPRRSAEFDGDFRLGAQAGWRLTTVSPQRLRIDLTGDVKLTKARYRDFRLTPRPGPGEPANAQPSFTIQGLIQFPRVMPQVIPGGAGIGLGLSARAIGTRGKGEWRIDVGEQGDVSFDIGGILRHLFTIYVNKRLIAFDQPHLVNEALLRPFFQALGLDGPPGQIPRVLRVGFVRDDNPTQNKDWMVAICDFGGPKGVPDGVPVGLGPAPSSRDETVFELLAGGVPGNLVERFPNLALDDPGVKDLLKQVKVAALRLTLRLKGGPETWFRDAPPAPKPPILNENGGASVARRVLELFRASASLGKVFLVGKLSK
jgi:hypothetical protein